MEKNEIIFPMEKIEDVESFKLILGNRISGFVKRQRLGLF